MILLSDSSEETFIKKKKKKKEKERSSRLVFYLLLHVKSQRHFEWPWGDDRSCYSTLLNMIHKICVLNIEIIFVFVLNARCNPWDACFVSFNSSSFKLSDWGEIVHCTSCHSFYRGSPGFDLSLLQHLTEWFMLGPFIQFTLSLFFLFYGQRQFVSFSFSFSEGQSIIRWTVLFCFWFWKWEDQVTWCWTEALLSITKKHIYFNLDALQEKWKQQSEGEFHRLISEGGWHKHSRWYYEWQLCGCLQRLTSTIHTILKSHCSVAKGEVSLFLPWQRLTDEAKGRKSGTNWTYHRWTYEAQCWC